MLNEGINEGVMRMERGEKEGGETDKKDKRAERKRGRGI